MKDNRREFLKKAALFTGGAGLWGSLPATIQKAMAINPEPGSTYLDAEHVVILMQENRSFDHCFGKLKGVRGFNDPRALRHADQSPIWLQKDNQGQTFAPFRLNIKDTKATWMSAIPHSWENQVDARNGGRHDGWIEAKRPGREAFRHVPLTMGFYDREDIPFYYAFAEAFTVCDQHFCASLTGTTTNRNYLWAGKSVGNPGEKPLVRNGEHTYGKEVDWKTFPERLQDHGISWKVYQNEVSVNTLLEGEDESWLANFTDNNLEWFRQFGVRYTPGHYEYLQHQQQRLSKEIAQLENSLDGTTENEAMRNELEQKKADLRFVKETIAEFNPEKFAKLSDRERELHQRAFTTNTGDPDYHHTERLQFKDQGVERETRIPKGDIFHAFRQDVKKGTLPTVSYLVAPKNFSDHPSAPWYGAWYVSEALDILTSDPEVWKKTIFILNYDENDGYFDHVPPFVPPKPGDLSTGRLSEGLDARSEFVTLDQELSYPGIRPEDARESPVGLGYRVPLIVASPWSRGGWVNSEVCDITSTIMFMEKLLSHKTGKRLHEDNISSWRRNICGDLTSVFRPYNGEEIPLPESVDMEEHVKSIYNAAFKDLPDNFKVLDQNEIQQANRNPMDSPWIPKQETGTRPSSALAYELYVDGEVDTAKGTFALTFNASDRKFGKKALGAPFLVYAPGTFRDSKTGQLITMRSWSFALKPGDQLLYQWPLEAFRDEHYHLLVYGPNGFFREFRGNNKTSGLKTKSVYKSEDFVSGKGYFLIELENQDRKPVSVRVQDNAYGQGSKSLILPAGDRKSVRIATASSHGWYDFSLLQTENDAFLKRYAGRLEFGRHSRSDPHMGRENLLLKQV
ncbi:phospholipase C [Cyclobacterium lianum]|uniref:phospholipase C n=1 Tax=Cyclobacterium lianum TaxID=388280 RepID=A0A1M7KXG9_9BACT|nr:phospholipase C, phosphocholine-specific [Cyclobacterium lianum]SHM70243.1 phospholipase C [Cyclobacterium lianum]